MSLETWFMYALAVLAICITPGPDILLAMTSSLTHGLKRTAVLALGCITATFCMAIISASGLGAILMASENAFILLKWVGGAYLFYIGISIWRNKEEAFPTSKQLRPKNTVPYHRLYLKGFFVSISNPKSIVFFGAFFPIFVDPAQSLLPQFSLMTVTFVFIAYSCIMTYASITSRLAPYLQKDSVSRQLARLSGGLFMGLGITLVYSEK